MAILNLVELIGMQFLISFSQLWSVLEAYLQEGSTTLLEAKHFTQVTYWWQPSKPATSLVTSKVLLRNHPWHIGAIGVGQPNHTQRLKGERFLSNIYFRDICTMTCPFVLPVLCLPADSEGLDWIQRNLGIWLLPSMCVLKMILKYDALKSPPESKFEILYVVWFLCHVSFKKTHFLMSGISRAPPPLESVGTKPMLPTNPPNSNSLASLMSKLWGVGTSEVG